MDSITPTVAVTVVIAIIGYIVWQVRLEAKLSSIKEQLDRLEKELAEVWKEFENHRLNQDIHFNLRVSSQVEQSNERRFVTIERQLTEINAKLDKMAEKK